MHWLREGQRRRADKEMTWSESHWIIALVAQWTQRPRVQAGLDLGSKSRELLEGQCGSTDDSTKVVLEAAHCSLREAAEMWCSGRDEFPLSSLSSQLSKDFRGEH